MGGKGVRMREDEKGEKRVFRKIREKLEQILGLGEISGIREDEIVRRRDGGNAVFRKIREKLEQILVLGKI